MMKQYEDIINHQRPISRKHKPMSMRDRAAQFASFAALSGYEDMVEEKRLFCQSLPLSWQNPLLWSTKDQ